MTWKIYRVVFRLLSPMHVGCGKVGNMLFTSQYITGRVLWGALTQRLTRDMTPKGTPAKDSKQYKEIGEKIDESMVFTYFYPATQKTDGEFDIVWPWNENFKNTFLASYATTALAYPEQAAEEGSLHEVEFISPYRTDTGERVYLIGYIAENGEFSEWKNTLNRLQFGGERCYGWGRVEVADFQEHDSNESIFFDECAHMILHNGLPPRIRIASEDKQGNLLAHALPDNGLQVEGNLGPLVGREWRSDDEFHKSSGQYVDYSGFCFQPGSRVLETTIFNVNKLGIWLKTPDQ